jgi:AcrR family transcriptional regulator
MTQRSAKRTAVKPRNAEQTKHALLLAAQHHFSRSNYADVGLRDIAARAGANPALIARYFGSKKGLFSAALTDAMDSALPDDFFHDIGGPRIGSDFVDAFMRDQPEHAGVFSMLIHAAGDVNARDVALAMIRKKVVEPIRRLLGDDEHAGERADRIVAVASGVTMFRQLLPLDTMAGPISSSLREWLARTLQQIVDERP